jgi:hypothetical protein
MCKAEQQDYKYAHRHRNRKRPKRIAKDQYGKGLRRREVGKEQSATDRGNLRRHNGQEPNARHLLNAVLLQRKHEEWDREAANDGHDHVKPPRPPAFPHQR